MMQWQLQSLLSRVSRRADPDREFVRSLRARLATVGSVPEPVRAPVWKFAYASSVFLFCLCLSMGSYAYASDDVLPGTLLYPVRQKIEAAEVRLAPLVRIPKEKVAERLLVRRATEARLVRAREVRQLALTGERKAVNKVMQAPVADAEPVQALEEAATSVALAVKSPETDRVKRAVPPPEPVAIVPPSAGQAAPPSTKPSNTLGAMLELSQPQAERQVTSTQATSTKPRVINKRPRIKRWFRIQWPTPLRQPPTTTLELLKEVR